MEIPKKIKEAIQNDRLIVFAGSGLSMKFGLPSWKKLVNDIIKETNDSNLTPFITLMDSNYLSPVEVLEKIKSKHNDIKAYIQDNFKLDNSADLYLHKKILELTGKIVTTNYDNAFELASDNIINPTIYTSQFNVSEINKSTENYIFKLHGSYSEPDHCILFNDQYERLYHENTAAKEKLKSIFTEKVILFLGFSFNDQDINLIFENLDKAFGNNNKHYILTPETEKFNAFSFLETINISNYNDIPDFIDVCLNCKTIDKTQNRISTSVDNLKEKSIPKIAFLSPNPLDMDFSDEITKVLDCFKALNSEIYIGCLNVDSLENIDEYDLLIITSKIFKSKIYIEDENLKSDLFSFEEIYSSITNENIPIILITNEHIDTKELNNLAHISTFKSAILKRFIYKAFKEKTSSFNDEEIKCYWQYPLSVTFEKGKSTIYSLYGNNNDLEIGKKSLSDVIGRVEEQSLLSSKLKNICRTNKLLNIKASGGTGKTTIIKKVAYELYNRGYYKDGITFSSCEKVKNYEDFENILTQGFNLLNIINFKEYLQINFSRSKYDLLVILDNFETVVNNLDSTAFKEVISLLKFVTDYGNVVITSREKISDSEDFEDVFSLTPLITDDAEKLFIHNYGPVSYIDERKILRQDILEDLLNNNPLAIKLVTNSRTRFKHIGELRDQLKQHFFESVNEDYSSVYKQNSDLNIERTRSIFQSINYSYTTLNSKEKIAFELLSLFPDGISLINFKHCFAKKSSSSNISDREFKTLKDKSLIEDYNGNLQLQPIIRRFADFQFNKRSEESKKNYCSDAYKFNCYVLDYISDLEMYKTFSKAQKVFYYYRNNLLEVLSYMHNLEISKDSVVPNKIYLLNYLTKLSSFVINDKLIREFNYSLKMIREYFTDIPNADTLINVLKLQKVYLHEEFDESYNELSKIFPSNRLTERQIDKEEHIDELINSKISAIHSMEGHTLSYISSHISNNSYDVFFYNDFYYLGIPNSVMNERHGFYYFEYELMFGRINIPRIEKYISSLHKDQHLEIMQTTYTLSKIKKVNMKVIQKLVVTNPYTRGLKNLMEAFISENSEDKENMFIKALENLYHIKYYYLEALYYYCIFLKGIQDSKFEDNLNLGLTLSNKFRYQYQNYLFNRIKDNGDYAYLYNSEYYNIPELDNYLNQFYKKWNKIFKQS